MRRPAVLAFAVLLLVACGLSLWRAVGRDETPDAAPQDPPPVSSVAQTPADEPTGPVEPLPDNGFDSFFVPGVAVAIDEDATVLDVLETADLAAPTGRLIACDPFVQADDHDYVKPFSVRVPPGHYGMEVAVAVFDNGVRLPVAARVIVSAEPVARWELATREGEDARELGPEQFYGFGVDTGMAAFVDEGALAALTSVAVDEDGPLMTAIFEEDGAAAWSVPDDGSGQTITAYRSGFGDGSYPTWLGRTAEGEPAQFVTDLHVIDPPAYRHG